MTGVEALAWMSAQAFEAGAAGWAQQPGILLGGVSAEGPPPGLYMVDQAYTYQTNLAGAGADAINPHGTKTGAPAAVAATAFVWAPGWTFLGGSTDSSDVSQSRRLDRSVVHDTSCSIRRRHQDEMRFAGAPRFALRKSGRVMLNRTGGDLRPTVSMRIRRA